MRILLSIILLVASLAGANYTLNPGWNLLGTSTEIPISKILANEAVRNVVIYKNGAYESSASNDFSTIPANSGFFVYTDNSTTINITDGISSTELLKLDGNLEVVPDGTWSILKIVDANLLIEMKTTTFKLGTTYNYTEAESYCSNLTIGSLSGWRLPTLGELEAISTVYHSGYENYFLLKDSAYYWSSSDSYYGKGVLNLKSGDGTSKLNDYRYLFCVKSLD